MRKVLPLICLGILFAFTLFAQDPCPPFSNAAPGATPPGCRICSSTVIADNAGYGPGQAFDCGVPHNSTYQYIVADSSGALSATFLASNCQTGDGLQLIVFDAATGAELGCFSSQGAITGNVQVGGLTPGGIYIIMIDGFNADVCEYTLIVQGGASTGPPDAPGPMRADPDTTLCPGAIACYEIDPVNGAETYDWTLPQNVTIISGGGPNDTRVCVRVDEPGGGVVQVVPSNACFPGVPSIIPLVATPIVPAFWPPKFICQGDMPWDTSICGQNFSTNTFGGFEINCVTALGCDSLVKFSLVPVPQVPGIVDTVICAGDSVKIGPAYYKNPGGYQITLTGPQYQQANGCDSTVRLALKVLDPIADIAEPDDLPCTPGSTVSLDGSMSSSGTGFTYNWTTENGGTIVSGTMSNVAAAGSPGTYILAVTQVDSTGTKMCIGLDTVEVMQANMPLNDPVFSNATTNTCINEPVSFSITPVTGAVTYIWTTSAGDTLNTPLTDFTITPTSVTTVNVCVQAIGTCGESQQVCIPVSVNQVPTADFTVTDPICIDGSSTIQYTGNASPFATFTWNFNGGTPATVTGAGPHDISWNSPGPKTITLAVEENGCMSTTETRTVTVEAALDPPVISCDPTQTSVTFNWAPVNGATDYTVVINGGAPVTQPGTSFPVTGLNPGDNVTITVTANTTSACGPSMASSDCTAEDCPTVTIDVDAVQAICRDASTGAINLNATQSGGAGGGSFLWSGPGTSGNGSFDPNAANVGTNTVSVVYTEGTCTWTGSTTVDVNDVPDPSFTVTSPICETEVSNIMYTGSASASASYVWDVGAGTITTGTGAGPLEVSFPAGSQTVSLTVSENGCTSVPNSQPVQVDATLPDPVIRCGTLTTTSVEFIWDEVPGATNYVVNGPGGEIVDMNNRTVTVNGLNSGDAVTIEIVAEGNGACPPSRTSFTCEASNCPPEPITIDPVGPFCDDGTGAAVMLTASAGNNAGTFEWTGPGVSNGMFDPNAATVNPGDLTLNVTYTIDNCTYNESTVVTIFGVPSSAFSVVDPICITDASDIEYTGNADRANATFSWDFGGGTPATANTAGPHSVSWGDEGAKDITLTVEENGCTSQPTTQQVNVQPELIPSLIICDSDERSIRFSWDAVQGAVNYTVDMTNAPAAAVGDFNNANLIYEVTGLTPGDEVTIVVTVEGLTECPPITFTETCTAINCEELGVIMPIIDTSCVTNSALAFLLDTVSSFSITKLSDGTVLTTDSVDLEWVGPANTTYLTSAGRFFPQQAISDFGSGEVPISVIIEYPIGSECFTTFNGTIPLREVPAVEFRLDPAVCVDDMATLEMNMGLHVDPTSTYDWDWGRATAVPGTGIGPHTLTWTEGGFEDMIGLSVTTIDGCESAPINAPIRVDSTLNALAANLRCNPDNTTNTSIEFIWDTNVPGVGSYDISLVNAPPGVMLPPGPFGSSVFFDNLNPEDEIEVQLTLTDPNSMCPPVSTTFTCIAKQCDPIDVAFVPIADNCFDPGNPTPIQLEVVLTPDPGAGMGTRTFSGDNVTADGVFTPDAQGSYNIEFLMDLNRCPYPGNTTIQMIETPIAAFSIDPVICEEDDATLRFLGAAHPDAVLTWDFDNGTPGSMDPFDPTTVSWAGDPGDKTVTLSIDNNGCTDGPFSQMIQVDPTIDPIVINCEDLLATTTSVSITWNDDPNVNEYEVRVSYPMGTAPRLISTQSNTDFTFPDMMPGDDDIEIIITPISDSSCPKSSTTATCEALPCPNVQSNVEPIGPLCIDDAPVAINVTLSNGAGSLVPTIDGPGVNTALEFDPSLAGEGTHTLTIEYSEQGCDYSWTEAVIVNPLPRVDAGSDQILSCNDTEVELTGNDHPGGTYTWTFENGDLSGNTKTVTVENGGTYTLEVTDANGCVNSDEVFVDAAFSNPSVDAVPEQISCFGREDGIISVNGMTGGVPPFEFSFNGGPFSPSNTFFSNLGEGTYTIVGRDANGCEATVTLSIEEPTELTVEILISGGDNPVPFGDSIELTANTNYDPSDLTSILWSPVDQFPICDETNIDNCITAWVSPAGQTVYTVVVENENGCTDDDNINIIGMKDHPIYIPSGFSPGNGDGNNDFFGIYGDPTVVTEIKSFLVFDRWGEVIFENYNFPVWVDDQTIQPENGWDGTFRGQKLNSGVYVYMIEAEFFDGLIEIYKGDITIK